MLLLTGCQRSEAEKITGERDQSSIVLSSFILILVILVIPVGVGHIVIVGVVYFLVVVDSVLVVVVDFVVVGHFLVVLGCLVCQWRNYCDF